MDEQPQAAQDGPQSDSSRNTVAHRLPAAAPTPEVMRQVAEAVRGSFPRPFTEPELVLIDVDPRHIHAFWNLPAAAVEAARAATPGLEGETAPFVLRLRQLDGGEAFDTEVQGLHGQVYIDVWDDARAYEGELGLRLGDGRLHRLISAPPVLLPALPDAPARPAPVPAEPMTEPAPVPAEPMTGPAVAGAAAGNGPPPLALETVLTLSSHALGRETVQFEVNAELHIFGRARPGSELRLFGRRVALRPDGTFSINRPLPHGALVLSALLVGGDGD